MLPLDEQQFRDLLNQLDAWTMQPNWGRLLSSQTLQGAQNSRHHGSGSEFADSRPYALGDEIRHLDWRLMARSGEAFSRRFEEQRQAQWVVAVDMRQSMWFGTRRQFKVTQALNLLAMIVWQAQRHNVNLQLWVIGEKVKRIQLAQLSGQSLVLSCLQALNHPHAYWEPEPQESISLAQACCELFSHSDAGSTLYLLSDLHDLLAEPKFAGQLLAWRQRLNLNFLWCYDPAEVSLPSAPGLQIQGLLGRALRLDRAVERNHYHAWAQDHFQQIEQALQRSGVSFSAVSTMTALSSLPQLYQSDRNSGVLASEDRLMNTGVFNG